ncbi:MAG: acyltransferase family protein [Treponema sp.]|nr:acyltransferase family protein [Treponema sp.]
MEPDTECQLPISPEKPKPIAYLNVLRVTGITGVLITHVFMTTCGNWAPVLPKSELYFCTVLRNLWHWCVPVLVMISGVLFLNPEKEITISKIINRYVVKMVLVLALLAIPAEAALQFVASGYHFSLPHIKTAVLNIAQGKTQTHYWFLFLIIGLYLITPLLRAFTRYASKKEYEYLLVILFIFTSVIATIKKLALVDFGINIPISSVYVLYFLFGFYIHRYNITFPLKAPLAVILCFVLYTALASLNKGMVNPSLDNMLITSDKDSPIIVLTAAAIFIASRAKCAQLSCFDPIAPLCFVIYLVHPFFIYALYLLLNWTPENYPLPLFLPVTILATFGLSLGTSFCVQRYFHIMRRWRN